MEEYLQKPAKINRQEKNIYIDKINRNTTS